MVPSLRCWGLEVANGWDNQRDYIKIHSLPTQSCAHFLVHLANKCLQDQCLNNIYLHVKALNAHAVSHEFF